MDPRRLQLLSELSRLGSMRAVADALGLATSTVSQQISVLAREVGTPLIEPDGRRIRLTAAGHRLAGHALTILAAVEAARLDLDPDAEPAGTVRVASFATAIRRSLLPLTTQLATSHPKVGLRIQEHAPADALALLADDEVDLAVVYEFTLAPVSFSSRFEVTPLWSLRWGLGVPDAAAATLPAPASGRARTSAEVFAHFRTSSWIVDSRNEGDEKTLRAIASLADFVPEIRHRADSLDLVQDFILAGLGIGVVPVAQPVLPGVAIVPLTAPEVILRAYAVIRRGRAAWPPIALITRMLTNQPMEHPHQR